MALTERQTQVPGNGADDDKTMSRREFIKSCGFGIAGIAAYDPLLRPLFEAALGRHGQPDTIDYALAALNAIRPMAGQIDLRDELNAAGQLTGRKKISLIIDRYAAAAATSTVAKGPQYLRIDINNLPPRDADHLEKILQQDEKGDEQLAEKVAAQVAGITAGGAGGLLKNHRKAAIFLTATGTAVAGVSYWWLKDYVPLKFRFGLMSPETQDRISGSTPPNSNISDSSDAHDVQPSSPPPPPPEPTPIGEPRATEIPVLFKEEKWASFTRDSKDNPENKPEGTVNFEKMFPVVGSINHRNRQMIDAGFADMKLAIDVGRSLKDESDHNLIRAKIVEKELDTNDSLKRQLLQIRDNLKVKDYSNITIVLEGDGKQRRATQAVYKKGDELVRYKIGGVNVEEVKEPFNLLPQLRVEGPYILRTDRVDENARKIQIAKGVNLNTFMYGTQRFSNAKDYILQNVKLEGNAIRILFDIQRVNIDEMMKAIDFAEINGMYVIVSPASDGTKNINSITNRSSDIILRLADKYKSRSHVMFEPINEVDDTFDEKWYDDFVQVSESINEINPNAFIWVAGTIWSRNFSIYIRRPLPFKNVGYDVHYYKNTNSRGIDTTATDLNFEWMLDKMPVMFSEAGVPANRKARDNPDDQIYIRRMREITRRFPLTTHWIAFEMAPGNWPTSLIDLTGNLSSRGEAFYDSDPADSPPTNFRQ